MAYELRTKLSGTSYVQDNIRRFAEPGIPYQLVHETDNEWDDNAVSCRLAGTHLGYIPRDKAGIIATLLDMGVNLVAHCYQVNECIDPYVDRIGVTIDIKERTNEQTAMGSAGNNS